MTQIVTNSSNKMTKKIKVAKKAKETKKEVTAAPAKIENDALTSILSIGNEVLVSKGGRFGATIYNPDVFASCKTTEEKKRLRIKLRRKLQAFMDTYSVSQKNKEKLALLKKDWADYASKVYKDASLIVDNNASEEKIALAQQFLKAMSN